MRVLFSLTFYSPYISGLTIFTKRLAEELAEAGNEVKIICFKHKTDLKGHEYLNKVGILRVNPWFKISKGFISGGWIRNCMQAINNTDLVVVVLPQAEGCLTALVAKLMNKKVIAIYLCKVQTKNKMVNRVLEMANDLTLKMADEVVTLTEDYAKTNQTLSKYINKLRYIYPLISRPAEDPVWKKTAKKKIGRRNPVIGVAVRMATEKGLEYLFQAIPKLKSKLGNNFCVAVVGPSDTAGEEIYKKYIMKLVRNYEDRVVWLGEVPEDKMGSFYSLLDVLVLPSTNSTEAFGMVQVEAMLWNIPVVATDLPGVRVPINKTGMGIVVPIRNEQTLAEGIIQVLKNKNIYSQRQKVVREFDFRKTTNQWNKLFLG
jgi:glycosyltransferase involved in cell wall biosynthesis